MRNDRTKPHYRVKRTSEQGTPSSKHHAHTDNQACKTVTPCIDFFWLVNRHDAHTYAVVHLNWIVYFMCAARLKKHSLRITVPRAPSDLYAYTYIRPIDVDADADGDDDVCIYILGVHARASTRSISIIISSGNAHRHTQAVRAISIQKRC